MEVYSSWDYSYSQERYAKRHNKHKHGGMHPSNPTARRLSLSFSKQTNQLSSAETTVRPLRVVGRDCNGSAALECKVLDESAIETGIQGNTQHDLRDNRSQPQVLFITSPISVRSLQPPFLTLHLIHQPSQCHPLLFPHCP
jgi:hypothetical protein